MGGLQTTKPGVWSTTGSAHIAWVNMSPTSSLPENGSPRSGGPECGWLRILTHSPAHNLVEGLFEEAVKQS